jgi:hypothetical protein
MCFEASEGGLQNEKTKKRKNEKTKMIFIVVCFFKTLQILISFLPDESIARIRFISCEIFNHGLIELDVP